MPSIPSSYAQRLFPISDEPESIFEQVKLILERTEAAGQAADLNLSEQSYMEHANRIIGYSNDATLKERYSQLLGTAHSNFRRAQINANVRLILQFFKDDFNSRSGFSSRIEGNATSPQPVFMDAPIR